MYRCVAAGAAAAGERPAAPSAGHPVRCATNGAFAVRRPGPRAWRRRDPMRGTRPAAATGVGSESGAAPPGDAPLPL